MFLKLIFFTSGTIIGMLWFLGYFYPNVDHHFPIGMIVFLPNVDQNFPIGMVVFLYCFIFHVEALALSLAGQYNTPLTCAIYNGNTEIAKLLLLHGAKENHLASSGRSPLYVSCVHGRSEICNML